MTVKYEILIDPITKEPSKNIIKRINEDGAEWFIPCDPANSDYQRYLRWLENPKAEQFNV